MPCAWAVLINPSACIAAKVAPVPPKRARRVRNKRRVTVKFVLPASKSAWKRGRRTGACENEQCGPTRHAFRNPAILERWVPERQPSPAWKETKIGRAHV